MIWADKFKSVIEGFCSEYNIDPSVVLAGRAVTMGEVNLCLGHNADVNSPLITVFAEFGKVPPEHEARVHKQLLEANLTSYSGQGETYCLAPDGSVVFATNYPLEILTPPILAGSLALVAIVARHWRKDYTLDIKEITDLRPPKKTSQNERIFKQAVQK